VRRCPECGAILPVKALSCSECGYRFVVQLQPPRIPKVAAGEVERVDDDGVSDQKLSVMSYRQLLVWCQDDPLRLRRARLIRRKADGSRYAKGWEWHTAMAWREAQTRTLGHTGM